MYASSFLNDTEKGLIILKFPHVSKGDFKHGSLGATGDAYPLQPPII